MAQWLNVLTTLAKDPGSIPTTYMAAHNHLYLQFQGIGLLLDSESTVHMGYTHAYL